MPGKLFVMVYGVLYEWYSSFEWIGTDVLDLVQRYVLLCCALYLCQVVSPTCVGTKTHLARHKNYPSPLNILYNMQVRAGRAKHMLIVWRA